MDTDKIKPILTEEDREQITALWSHAESKDPWDSFHALAKLKDLLQFNYFESFILPPDKRLIIRDAIEYLFKKMQELGKELSKEVGLSELIELIREDNGSNNYIQTALERSLSPFTPPQKITVLELIKFKVSEEISKYRKHEEGSRPFWFEEGFNEYEYQGHPECFEGSPFRIKYLDYYCNMIQNMIGADQPESPPPLKLVWQGANISFFRLIRALKLSGCFGDIPESTVTSKLFGIIKGEKGEFNQNSFRAQLKEDEWETPIIETVNLLLSHVDNIDKKYKFDNCKLKKRQI